MFKSAVFVVSLDLGDSPAFPELAHSGIFQSLFLSGRENVLDPCFPTSKEASPTLTLQCQNNQFINLLKLSVKPVLGNHVKKQQIF